MAGRHGHRSLAEAAPVTMAALLLPLLLSAGAPRRNVLMLAVDDLRAEFGQSFSSPEVLTPHIDKLAASSVVFTRNFCQAATCGISRSSLLTGRRPDTTRVLENGGCPFTTAPEHRAWVSLPVRSHVLTLAGTLAWDCTLTVP